MGEGYDPAYDSHSEYFTKVGNASLDPILPMVQRVDRDGTCEDDPDAEWVLTRLACSLTLTGAVTFYAVDADGNSEVVYGPAAIAGNSGFDLPVDIHLGRARDLAYTTTGGGDVAGHVTAHRRQYAHSRPAGEFP